MAKFKLTHKGEPIEGEKGKYSRYIIWIKIPGVDFWRKAGVVRRLKVPGRKFEDDSWRLTIYERGNDYDGEVRSTALKAGMERIHTNMPTLEW